MGLNKSRGNMYDWVTHTWSPIIGCSHQCQYCYVKSYRDQPANAVLREDFPNLGKNRTIFVGHMCDMFSAFTPFDMIVKVLNHCFKFPENKYVFQTKNPARFQQFGLPFNSILGTTIETNREDLLERISSAPSPQERAEGIAQVTNESFITVEPILDFDVKIFADLIKSAEPDWVNIGADSKGHGLPEPTKKKVMELVLELQKRKINIRKKMNLDRLISK